MSDNWIVQLVEGGFVAQAVLGSLIGGAVLWQVIHNQPIDDQLKTWLTLLLGYYFHMGVSAASRAVFQK